MMLCARMAGAAASGRSIVQTRRFLFDGLDGLLGFLPSLVRPLQMAFHLAVFLADRAPAFLVAVEIGVGHQGFEFRLAAFVALDLLLGLLAFLLPGTKLFIERLTFDRPLLGALLALIAAGVVVSLASSPAVAM